jgi:hypothetical protein
MFWIRRFVYRFSWKTPVEKDREKIRFTNLLVNQHRLIGYAKGVPSAWQKPDKGRVQG